MSFPNGTFNDDDMKKVVESDSDHLKKISGELESLEKKAGKEKEGESPIGDSSTENKETAISEKDTNNKENESPNDDSSSKKEESVISEKDNNKDNEIKEESFPYEWLVEYNYPETLHNLIIHLNMKKEDLLSLPINDFKDLDEVYKAIRKYQKERFDEWDSIIKDEMLRTHALEGLITGYNDLNEKFDLIKINSEAQLQALEQVDELMNGIIEKGEKEIGHRSGFALDAVAGAMENQIKEFRKAFNEENKARKEFFKNEYTQLKEGLDKAIKDSNIKNAINKTTIILFIAMIFTQMLTLGLLGYIYKM